MATAISAILKSRISKISSLLITRNLIKIPNVTSPGFSASPLQISNKTLFLSDYLARNYHDGRPRGSLWRGKKLIGKEAIFVILGLKRFKDDEEKLGKFIKSHVLRLLKMDMVAVLNELERQEETSLAVKV